MVVAVVAAILQVIAESEIESEPLRYPEVILEIQAGIVVRSVEPRDDLRRSGAQSGQERGHAVADGGAGACGVGTLGEARREIETAAGVEPVRPGVLQYAEIDARFEGVRAGDPGDATSPLIAVAGFVAPGLISGPQRRVAARSDARIPQRAGQLV